MNRPSVSAAFISLAVALSFGSISLFAPGCSDSGLPHVDTRFPDMPGSFWVYATYDSVAGAADTVTATIGERRTVTIGGREQSARVWHLTSSTDERLWYVVTHGDTVSVWLGTPTEVQYLDVRLVFPVEVGREWTMPPCGDVRVTKAELVPVPDIGKENMAYTIVDEGGCLNDYWSNTWTFVPGIGFLTAHRRCFGFCTQNSTWDLVLYRFQPL